VRRAIRGHESRRASQEGHRPLPGGELLEPRAERDTSARTPCAAASASTASTSARRAACSRASSLEPHAPFWRSTVATSSRPASAAATVKSVGPTGGVGDGGLGLAGGNVSRVWLTAAQGVRQPLAVGLECLATYAGWWLNEHEQIRAAVTRAWETPTDVPIAEAPLRGQ
jgi:hypothetical protein